MGVMIKGYIKVGERFASKNQHNAKVMVQTCATFSANLLFSSF